MKMKKNTIELLIVTIFFGLLVTACNSPDWRHTSYDYSYYYSRHGGYHYAPGTGQSYSWDSCNTLAEGEIKGSFMYLTVKDGPWVAFPITRDRQPFKFMLKEQGMFMYIFTSQGPKVWTQKNGDTWEQRPVSACILLK